MKKIIVIGCPGSGKSFFSKKLAAKTGIKVYHLDNLFWNADRTYVSKEVFDERLNEVVKEDEWIIDGNFNRTLELRLKACDTVFFMDLDTEACLAGVKERQGKPRSDIPWTGNEDGEEFTEFIKNFGRDMKPEILRLLEKYNNKKVYTFTNRTECNEFLEKMSGNF